MEHRNRHPDLRACHDILAAQGTITSADLTGPRASKPLIKLVDEIGSGQVYVNVHSTDHPGGEMRGQLS